MKVTIIPIVISYFGTVTKGLLKGVGVLELRGRVEIIQTTKYVRTCCIVTANYTYTYTCGNIVNTIMTSEHSSLEKYTSHTLFEMVAKGLRKGYV